MSESDFSDDVQEVQDVVDQGDDVEDSGSEPAKKVEDSSFIDFSVIPEEHRGKVQSRINADFRKLKDAERKYQETTRKLREYEQKLAEASKPAEVTPPTPDDWYADPDAAQKRMQAYADSMAKSREWQLQQEQRQSALQAEIEREKREQFESFGRRAQEVGIKPERLATAALILDKALPSEHQRYLLEHEFGPQLINALASDPVELAELANLSAYQVGVKLDKMSAAFRKKTKSNAPPPDEPIKGTGVAAKDPYGGLLGNFS